MSIKNWPGGRISDEAPVPSGPFQNSTASGVWTLDQVAYWKSQNQWPTAGNFANWVLTMTGASAFLSTINPSSTGNIFGAGTTAGSPNVDAFLTQVTPAGVVIDKKAVSGSDYEAFKSSIASDSSGNIYTFGYNIPTGVGQGQALVMKFNSSYSITWQKKFEFSSYSNDEGIASGGIDSSGNVYFASGYYNGSATIPMVFKLDTNGNVTWARSLTGTDAYTRYAVTDSSGNVYITTTQVFNAGVGAYRQNTVKMDTSGNITWQRSLYRSTANENVNAGEGQPIFVDASGNVYVVGRSRYQGVSGDDGGFVAKYNSSGTIQWNRDVGGSSRYLSLEGVTADASGNVYVCGKDNSNNRGLIFKFSSSGSLLWQRQFYYSGSSINLRGIYTDNTFVYVSGNTSLPADGALMVKLAVDGSGMGTTSGWVYDESTFSTATSGLTDIAGPFTSSTLSAYTTANTSLAINNRVLTDTLVGF